MEKEKRPDFLAGVMIAMGLFIFGYVFFNEYIAMGLSLFGFGVAVFSDKFKSKTNQGDSKHGIQEQNTK